MAIATLGNGHEPRTRRHQIHDIGTDQPIMYHDIGGGERPDSTHCQKVGGTWTGTDE
jgi:hypothetical protein